MLFEGALGRVSDHRCLDRLAPGVTVIDGDGDGAAFQPGRPVRVPLGRFGRRELLRGEARGPVDVLAVERALTVPLVGRGETGRDDQYRRQPRGPEYPPTRTAHPHIHLYSE